MQNLLSKINFEKSYFYSLIVFALVLPLSRASNSFFVLFLILLFVLKGDYKIYWQTLKSSPLVQGLVAFVSFATLSLLWSKDIVNGMDFLRLYWQWIAIFVIAFNVKKDQIRPIISAFIIGMFISELLSYGMFFDLWQFHGHGSESPTPFMHHIDYSVFLAFTALILLNRILSPRYTKKEKFVMFLFFITIAGNLFINKGRTGQVALLFSIIITVFFHFRFTYKSLLFSTLLIGVIFSTAYVTSSQFKHRVESAQKDIIKLQDSNYASSLGLRVAQYFVAYDILQKHYLIGVGVGDWKSASKEALAIDNHGFSKKVVTYLPKHHFHNQYLNVTVQMGLIGFFLLLYLLYRFVTLKIEDEELKELSILFIAVFSISCLAEPLWMKQFTNILFILFTGLFIGASLHSTDKKVTQD